METSKCIPSIESREINPRNKYLIEGRKEYRIFPIALDSSYFGRKSTICIIFKINE